MEAIYLALTQNGLQKALQAGATVWCGADTLTEEEFRAYKGSALSRFTYPLDDADAIAGAVDTIREHHPGAIIWLEAI